MAARGPAAALAAAATGGPGVPSPSGGNWRRPAAAMRLAALQRSRRPAAVGLAALVETSGGN